MRTRARRALPAILRRPGIAAIARAAAHAEEGAWIVGGAARDLLLGRADPDVDLAVSADPYALAEGLARRGFGTFVPLSESSPRVARLAGRRDIDLAAVEGAGIAEDLGRRDFTVNAVAIALAGSDWTDPFGGVEDLAARRLRAISEKTWLKILCACCAGAIDGDARPPPRPRNDADVRTGRAPPSVRGPGAHPFGAREAPRGRKGPSGAPVGRPDPRPFHGAVAGPLSGCRNPNRIDEGARRAAAFRAVPRKTAPASPRARRPRVAHGPAAAEAWLASRRFSRAEAREVAALLDLVARARSASSDLERWRWVRDAGGRAADALRLASLLDDPRPAVRAGLARRVRAARRPPRVTGRDIQAWLESRPAPGRRGARRDRGRGHAWGHPKPRRRPEMDHGASRAIFVTDSYGAGTIRGAGRL